MSLPVLFWVCIPCGLPLFLLSVSRLLWFSSAVSRSPCVSTFFVYAAVVSSRFTSVGFQPLVSVVYSFMFPSLDLWSIFLIITNSQIDGQADASSQGYIHTYNLICDTIWTSITLNLSGSAGFWEQVWCSVWYSSGSLVFVEFSCCMCTNVHIHPVAVQEASSSQLPPSCSWLQLRARRSLSSESHPCLCSAGAGEASQQAAERSRELMWLPRAELMTEINEHGR